MTNSDREERPTTVADVLPARSGFLRVRSWVLLDGNRNTLAAGIVIVGFFVFTWLGYSGFLDLGRTTTPMLYLYSALAGGNITLITIVITISQLILSRELRSPRELQLELESAEEYQKSVEAETSGPGVPEHPKEFLRVLVSNTHGYVMTLDSTIDEQSNTTLQTELTLLTSNLQTELKETLEELETSRRGVFPALATILDADFSARLNRSRWIRRANKDELSEAQHILLKDLEQRIEQLDIARQYFKTIYIMQELADIAKLVIYSGIIATITTLVFLVFTGYNQTPISPLDRLILVPLSVSIGLVPLALLIAHVLRIITVARRTAAITPFLSPSD